MSPAGTLCDTGPLVALINRRDDDHELCQAALPQLRTPFITTWSCLTEAMYLLGDAGGLGPQLELWGYVTDGLLQLHDPTADEVRRMPALMEQYGDAPMDLADASLVAAAEALGMRRVFTLDAHFRAYRVGKDTFEVSP